MAGRYFVSVKNGYFFILSHDTTPDLEDHAGELFDSQISQYPLVRHGDHWDYLVSNTCFVATDLAPACSLHVLCLHWTLICPLAWYQSLPGDR